jgi:hypothetical protein
MGGNLERNRWMIIDDADTKVAIAGFFAEVGRPYLAANAEWRPDERTQRVMDSAMFLVDHLAEVAGPLVRSPRGLGGRFAPSCFLSHPRAERRGSANPRTCGPADRYRQYAAA